MCLNPNIFFLEACSDSLPSYYAAALTFNISFLLLIEPLRAVSTSSVVKAQILYIPIEVDGFFLSTVLFLFLFSVNENQTICVK